MNDKEQWNESAFDGEDIEADELLKDGTDYTDVVEKHKNRKRNTIIATITIIALIAVGIFFGSKYLLENKEIETPEPTTQVSEPVEEIPSQTPDYVEPENPVANLLPNRPEISKDEIKAFVENDTLQTSHGTIITIPNSETQATVHECSVRNTTDFCNVGTIKSNDKTYNTYFLKDAVGSSFFIEPADFQEIQIDGTKAATLTINTLDGTNTPVLVIVQADGTGFMITSTDNDLGTLTTLAETIAVN